jgi:hypothetical protein
MNDEEKRTMGEQFIRATDSVGDEIAEGYSRFQQGFLAEAIEHGLDLLHERNKVMNKAYIQMMKLHQKLQVKLSNFITGTYKSVKK